MIYGSSEALRAAIESRIRNQSAESGLSPDRLRRRVVFERVMTRLQGAEPGRWVVKGGMAMEVRLRDAARLTKDLDLGLRQPDFDPTDLRERLIDALQTDAGGDGFVFSVGASAQLAADAAGHLTWRVPLGVELAGRRFGAIKLDVSPRAHELDETDTVALPNALAFAGIGTVDVEIVDVHRHAAEKLHAMAKDFGERENTRVRDLADLMLLRAARLLSDDRLAGSVIRVWAERERTPPPPSLPQLPAMWKPRYERLAAENDVDPPSFDAAAARAAALWSEMFHDRGGLT